MTKIEINYSDKTDEDLVTLARHPLLGENYKAELMRRNTEALNKNAKNSQKNADRILVLTFLMFAVAVFQIFIAIQSLPFSWYVTVVVTLAVGGLLYFIMNTMFNWFDENHPDED